MAEVRTVHTASLSTVERHAILDMLGLAFGDGFDADDFEHALGGMHALVWEGPELVGHGSVVMRRLLHGGRSLRTGYVEAVAVSPGHRRRGHGAVVMGALEQVILGGYEIGALSSTEMAVDFYAARGWRLWSGTASVVAPTGLERTEDDDGSIYVLPVTVELAPGGDLACDWRGGDVW